MIKGVILGFVALALTIGTIWIGEPEHKSYFPCPDSFCPADSIELQNGGFPLAFIDESATEGFVLSDIEIAKTYNPEAFVIDLVFWFGVATFAFGAATYVLKRFGKLAFSVVAALYLAGYSALLKGL